jgi:branched-chain amino acid transport system permease protein
MGGTLFAYLDGYVAPVTFNIAAAVSILAAAILGGARSVYGIFIGVGLMVVGPMQTTAFGEYAFIFYGVFLVAAGVLLRQGIAGLALSAVHKMRNRRGGTGAKTRAVPDERREIPPMAGGRLEVSGISKSFGGVRALSDVTFSVRPGEVVALIGPNGSGKTTLLNVICGYYKPDQGSVEVGDVALTGLSPHKIARAGVARTFQTPSIPHLTVRDAIAASRSHVSKASMIETMLRLGRYRRAKKSDDEAVNRLLAVVGLTHVAGVLAPSLPLGTRRLLELARSLAGEPRVLLLDEVASGLDDDEVRGLSSVIQRVRDSGGSVLLVEHNFALVRSLADRVVVLARGEIVVVDTPEAVARHPEVLQQYLGQPIPQDDPHTATENVHG